MPGGSRVVLANGKLLGPLENGEHFLVEDFALLEKYTASALTDKIMEIVKGECFSYSCGHLKSVAVCNLIYINFYIKE